VFDLLTHKRHETTLVARMSVATCETTNPSSSPGYRYAHPGYLVAYAIVAAFLYGLARYPEFVTMEIARPTAPTEAIAHPAE
jgi:hypothetical protein